MIHRLVITIEARNDELQAYMYYESVLTGLGERFLRELEDVYHILSHHPEYFSYTDRTKTVRDVMLKNFPYLVVYELIQTTVVILAAHNCSKKPRSA